jgi:cell division protein FtsL
MTDEEIKKKLSGSAKKMEEWLNGIEEDYTLDRIYDVAKDMDLNLNKVKVLQEKMPAKDFLNN